MMCFGIGAFGPLFAGLFVNDAAVYGGLAGVAAVAGIFAAYSLIESRHRSDGKPSSASS
jgi:hypothetical protein